MNGVLGFGDRHPPILGQPALRLAVRNGKVKSLGLAALRAKLVLQHGRGCIAVGLVPLKQHLRIHTTHTVRGSSGERRPWEQSREALKRHNIQAKETYHTGKRDILIGTNTNRGERL